MNKSKKTRGNIFPIPLEVMDEIIKDHLETYYLFSLDKVITEHIARLLNEWDEIEFLEIHTSRDKIENQSQV